MDSSSQKVVVLEQSVHRLGEDVKELKEDVKQVQKDLYSWFDRLESMVQDLRISNTKLEEQTIARNDVAVSVQKELENMKKVRVKLLLAVTGGGISLLVWFLQTIVLST